MLVPSSWSIEKTKNFGVTSYIVKESRKLKHGDLTEPIPAKSARYISDTTVEMIQSFYQSDEVS